MNNDIFRGEGPLDDQAIHEFVDGLGDRQSKRRIMAAMAADERLEQKVEGYRRINNSLTLLKRSIQPKSSSAQDELVAAIGQRLAKRRSFRIGSLRAVAAAAIIVSIGTGWLASLEPDRRAALRQSIDFRQADVAVATPRFNLGGDFGFEQASNTEGDDEITISWWQSQEIAKQLEMPNLQPLGFRLVSGAVINPSESPAFRLYYADGSGHGINLYIGMAEMGRDDAFTVLPEGQMSLHWRAQNLIFALVGSATTQNFSKVVELVSEAVIEAQNTDAAQANDGETNFERTNLPQSDGQAELIKPSEPASIPADSSDGILEQAPLSEEQVNNPEPL